MLDYASNLSREQYFPESPSNTNRKESADLESPSTEEAERFVAEGNIPLEERADSVLVTSPLWELLQEPQPSSEDRKERYPPWA